MKSIRRIIIRRKLVKLLTPSITFSISARSSRKNVIETSTNKTKESTRTPRISSKCLLPNLILPIEQSMSLLKFIRLTVKTIAEKKHTLKTSKLKSKQKNQKLLRLLQLEHRENRPNRLMIRLASKRVSLTPTRSKSPRAPTTEH